MKKNEYDAAEAVEIGQAAEVILGDKINRPDFDSSGGEPWDWFYKMDE